MNTDKLKSLVEFQGVQSYRTKAGKQKQVLKGIPKQEFWEVWRDHKEEIKAMGITLHFEKVNRRRIARSKENQNSLTNKAENERYSMNVTITKRVGAIVFFNGERWRIIPPEKLKPVGSYATRTNAIRAAKRNEWEVAE